MDRLAPLQRPDDRPAGFQRWRSLAFLHWEVPAAAVAALLPEGIEVDTFEGRAYVGVVPFTMRDVSPWWSPSVPGVSNFHELNVRTYVHAGGRPGVWFFSLDAASSIAVVAARTGWHLPYHRASMSLEEHDGEVRYQSRRLWPGPKPAELELHYRIGESIGSAVPDTFEHFLVERYLLFADSHLHAVGHDGGSARRSGELRPQTPGPDHTHPPGARPAGSQRMSGQVHHRPYPLHRAEVIEVRESVVAACGLPATSGPPHVLYSPGVDVDVFALKKVGGHSSV